MASSSSSSSSPRGSEYDVFLSFRGEDTRKTFVDHLYTVLVDRGIRTFKDDERLERGEPISSDLMKNIKESRIAVIVFSKNYATSSWCLDELVEILECRRTKGQIVLPIFYRVKASRVRHQKRSFAEAFRQHEENYKEDMERVKRWRDALKEAANLSGLNLQDAANGYEAKFIKIIVQEISEKLQPKPFRVAKYEVGIDARVDKIITLLDQDQLFVGICGIGGVGKTTVAKAVFNRKSKDFEGSCFLENVRQESAKDGGLAKLQTKLLRETLRDQTIIISDPDRGINDIKDRLGNKRLLLVLDDVDDQNILEHLVEQEWFGSGSRIILTTRGKRLLENYDVTTYNLELLNETEALELFSWHAFNRKKPEDDYKELSHHAKDYAKGLPLALQVLGSLLHNRGKQYWSCILDKLNTSPPKEIKENVYRVLKISYDCLNDEEMDIFLDIACFFNGCHKKNVMNVSKLPKSVVVNGIQILSERSLVNISKGKVVLMHDLIQEMGRGIVRQESKEPGERSRLWSCDDICHVFAENTVTEKIEAIMLPKNGLSLEGGLHVRADAFTKMRKLRMLKINGVQLDGCLTDLSNELRYIEWDGYPQEYLPYNFHPKRHVVLYLPNSLIKGICTNSKLPKMLKDLNLSNCPNLVNPNFPKFPFLKDLNLNGCDNLVEVEFEFQNKLKLLDLSYCRNLKKTPNLSSLPCLEELEFKDCTSLIEVHRSIEFHERLNLLSFEKCKNLKNLATRINLKSLQGLNLIGCSKLEKCPEFHRDMICLKDVSFRGSGIKELPPSVGYLEGLNRLDLWNCKMLGSLDNIGEMKSLRILELSDSVIKKLPSSIAQLSILELYWCDCNLDEESIVNLPHSLWKLHLSGNDFVSLRSSFSQLTNLYELVLANCERLQTLESLPSSIRCLDLRGCPRLQTLSLPEFTTQVLAQCCASLEEYSIRTKCPHDGCNFYLTECRALVQYHGNGNGNKKPNIYYSQKVQRTHTEISFPGSEIPSWFKNIKYESDGVDMTWVSLRIYKNSLPYLKGVSVCAVIGINQDEKPINDGAKNQNMFTINGKCKFGNVISDWINRITSDHIIFLSKPNTGWMCDSDGWCYITASFESIYPNERRLKAKKWGIYEVMDTQYYLEHINGPTIEFL